MNEAGDALRKLAGQLAHEGESLWAAGAARRARWLADAFAHLARTDSELGREAVSVLSASSGLSPAMVAWALESSLAPLTYEVLLALQEAPLPPRAQATRARPGRLCAVILAGNVVTGAARAIGYPLLYGWPVLAKASSGDDTFARLLEAALLEGDPELGTSLSVVTYGAEQEALTAALLEQADAVAVYGSDQTLNAVRAQLGATISFIGHGHGLGAAFVGRAALANEDDAQRAAQELARDVAAYDQRGCLSPHVAWVERGGRVTPARFGELLQRELAQLAVSWPRGRLPFELAGAQLSWRGLGALRGQLLEGDGFAVSYEDDGPFRLSPGWRNVQLIGIDDVDTLPARLAPLGVHLKALGIAGVPDPRALADALPARVAPRLCALGQMQLPPPDALHDALAPWDGLLRWVDS